MNTDVFVWLYAESGPSISHVERLFQRYERTLSRFDPNSELSALNQCPQPTRRVSRTLFDVLEAARWANHATDGLYDPTILAALELAGYDRSFEEVPQQGPMLGGQMARGCSQMQADFHGYSSAALAAFDLDRETLTVSRPPGMRLDLGGIGKGWTVDRAADLLHRSGPFFVNAGGDLYAHGFPDDRRGWAVEIEHPRGSGSPLAELFLANQALATSSIVKRSWRKGKDTMHHLIDPRTQRPATTDLLSVSVIAQRTVVAEIFAKVALILGRNDGLALLQATPNIAGLVYTTNDDVIITDGFPTHRADMQKVSLAS